MKNIPKTLSLEMYRMMLVIRKFETAIAEAYGEQKMCSPTHLYTGQEAVATGVSLSLQKTDKTLGYYRGHGYYLARGGDPKEMMAELYCKATGSNRGKGGSMLLSSPKVGYVGSSAIVGGGIPIAVGFALGAKMQNLDEVTVSFFGDAATEEGVFYESLNFAALKKLPVVFVCENNFYAVQSHISKRQAVTDNIYKRAEMFGIPSVKIDGNNVEEVYEASVSAVETARSGKGPFFIEALTYRWHEHVGPGDDTESDWRPKEELAFWKKRDPLLLFEKKLAQRGLLSDDLRDNMHASIDKTIREAFAFAIESPLPGPGELMTSVY